MVLDRVKKVAPSKIVSQAQVEHMKKIRNFAFAFGNIESVKMNVFIDTDRAVNKITLRYHTGILIYLNCTPIIWYSKAQNIAESSTVGSEFVAVLITVNMINT